MQASNFAQLEKIMEYWLWNAMQSGRNSGDRSQSKIKNTRVFFASSKVALWTKNTARYI